MTAKTTTSTELKTFPAPLLRLILSGGGGLPPAYGPIFRADGQEFVWDGKSGRAFAVSAANGAVISDDLAVVEGWRLPLCDGSPWLGRLAMVAAWMLDRRGLASWFCDGDHFCGLTIVTTRQALSQALWSIHTGKTNSVIPTPTVPTLPTHIAIHPTIVAIPLALPLALYDLPDVAARVATAAG